MIINNFDTEKKVFIVAEIGNNHEGNYSVAEEMIGKAAEAGVDAVKFQTFIPELYVSSADTSRLERLRGFQLSFDQFEQLSSQAKELGIIFFSTPFDVESAKFLNSIQPIFKIASGDNTFFPLIDTITNFGKPTIISTGLADMKLLEDIYTFWSARTSTENLAVLHCIASYPAPLEQANLGAICAIKDRFPEITVGFSDHTIGFKAASYAVAAGARIIEKHFTLDKNYSDFHDHLLSADPEEMKILVESVREASSIMGSGEKKPQVCESDGMIALRRSIAAANDLTLGTELTMQNITWVRPGTGIPPGKENLLIGSKLIRTIKQGELIQLEDVSK
jgi:N,N'-diacetyllegionaminate synthase